MLLEERDRIRVLYHSWGTRPIMEGNAVKGIVFESKEGRQAIYAKTVIDATGDGDIFRLTGTPFRALADSNTRSSTTALVWRIGGIELGCLYGMAENESRGGQGAVRRHFARITGFRSARRFASSRNDIMLDQ